MIKGCFEAQLLDVSEGTYLPDDGKEITFYRGVFLVPENGVNEVSISKDVYDSYKIAPDSSLKTFDFEFNSKSKRFKCISS